MGNLFCCFFFFLSPPFGLWYLSCLTRDRTWTHSSENPRLNHWTARETLGQSSCFARFWACIGCISGSSHVHTHLLAKMDSSKEAYGKVDITYSEVAPTLFWPPRSLSVHVWLGRSPRLWNWGVCGLLSLIWAGLSSSLVPAVSEFLSTGDELQLFSPGLIHLLLQNH